MPNDGLVKIYPRDDYYRITRARIDIEYRYIYVFGLHPREQCCLSPMRPCDRAGPFIEESLLPISCKVLLA